MCTCFALCERYVVQHGLSLLQDSPFLVQHVCLNFSKISILPYKTPRSTYAMGGWVDSWPHNARYAELNNKTILNNLLKRIRHSGANQACQIAKTSREIQQSDPLLASVLSIGQPLNESKGANPHES